MFKVLNETPPDKLEAALSPLLDIDGALRFLAVDIALVNTDGYWTRASDYSIYQDVKGRFHVIPHDMNEALHQRRRGRGRGPGGPPPDFGPRRTSGGPRPRIRRRMAALAVLRRLAAAGMGRRGGRGFGPGGGGPTSTRSSAWTTRPSRCARSCWRCRRCGRGISATCATSPRSWLDWKKLGPMAQDYQDAHRATK